MPVPNSTESWQDRAAAKRAARDGHIPDSLTLKSPPPAEVTDVTTFAFESVLSARDVEITSVPTVTFLVKKLQSGEWTAVEVTRAFCNRALVAQQLVSARPAKGPDPACRSTADDAGECRSTA